MDIRGKVALITGGASGIGAAIARHSAAAGAAPVVADIDTEAATAVAHEAGGRSVHLDVTDPASWERALDEVGPPDIAFLNAGISLGEADIAAIDDDRYHAAIAVNVNGVFFGARAMRRRMHAGGTVMATASLAGLTPMPTDPVYAATKHAIIGLVRSIAPSFGEQGIRVLALCPGMADTPLVRGTIRESLEAAGFPLIEADDIARAAMTALASGENGEAWAIQAGREPLAYTFRGVPGPRVPGREGVVPPGIPGG